MQGIHASAIQTIMARTTVTSAVMYLGSLFDSPLHGSLNDRILHDPPYRRPSLSLGPATGD